MTQIINLIAINPQGNTFKVEQGVLSSDTLLSVHLIPNDSDLQIESYTVDIVTESIIELLKFYDFKVIFNGKIK